MDKILVIADLNDKESIDKILKIEGDVKVLSRLSEKETQTVSDVFKLVDILEVKPNQYQRKILVKSSNEEFNAKANALIKHFPVNLGQYRPFIWRPNTYNGDNLDDLQEYLLRHKKADVSRFIMRLNVVNQNMRYLNAKKTKLYLQRAFIRAGFPARKKKVLATDKFKFKEFSFGIDYCIGQLYEIPVKSSDEIKDDLNQHLNEFGIVVEKLEVYSMAVKPGEVFDYLLSEVYTDFSFDQISEAIEAFNKADSYTVKIKVAGLMRDSWVTKEVDAKEYVKSIWCLQHEGKTVIRMISMPPVGLYQVLPSLAKTSQSNCYRFPVRRLDFFKKSDDFAFDIFSDTCEECGKEIEKNVFDESIHQHFCAIHIPVTDAISFSSQSLSEEQEKEDEILSEEGADSAQAMDIDNDVTDIAGEGDSLQEDNQEDSQDIDY